MPRELSRAEPDRLVAAGARVFVGRATAEPTAILSAWRDSRLPDGVTLIGCQLPGLNHFVPHESGRGCRYRTSYLAPGLRDACRRGVVELMPMHHNTFYRWLKSQAAVDLAVVQVSPPDDNGDCNLGPCVDLLPALAAVL